MKKFSKIDITVCAMLMLGLFIASYGGQLLAPLSLVLIAPTFIWCMCLHNNNQKAERLEKSLPPLKERLGYLLESAVPLNNRYNLATPGHLEMSDDKYYLLPQIDGNKIIATFPLQLNFPSRVSQAHLSKNTKTYLEHRIRTMWQNPYYDLNALGYYLDELDLKFLEKSQEMMITLKIKIDSIS